MNYIIYIPTALDFKAIINSYRRRYTRKWLLNHQIKVHDFFINSTIINIKVWFCILLVFTICLIIGFGILGLILGSDGKETIWIILGRFLGGLLIFIIPILIWQYVWLYKVKKWKNINSQLPDKNLFEIYVWKKWKKYADKYHLLGKNQDDINELIQDEDEIDDDDDDDNDLELQETQYYFYYGLKQKKFLNFLPWRFGSKNARKQMQIIYENSLFDFDNTYYEGGKAIKADDMFWGLYTYGWYDNALKYDEENNDFIVLNDNYRI